MGARLKAKDGRREGRTRARAKACSRHQSESVLVFVDEPRKAARVLKVAKNAAAWKPEGEFGVRAHPARVSTVRAPGGITLAREQAELQAVFTHHGMRCGGEVAFHGNFNRSNSTHERSLARRNKHSVQTCNGVS